jgi:hypothetical protein
MLLGKGRLTEEFVRVMVPLRLGTVSLPANQPTLADDDWEQMDQDPCSSLKVTPDRDDDPESERRVFAL